MMYRPDVDGLRAVAVLPVVLYHAHVPGFSGGFVGVDIFFVISGYLIAGIIARDVELGRFTVLDFYERRIRRIFPALFVMLAATALAAWWLLLPKDLVSFSDSVVSTALFYSNLQFWSETGYFARAADTKPLLHTWSLAVEEQFYIVFPLAMLALAAVSKTTRLYWLIGATVASFVAALATVPSDPSTGFFWLHTRAWELLVGVLLALRAVPPVRTAATANLLGVGGLALIAFSVVGYDHQTAFPGLAAVPPVLGAAMLIHAGDTHGARREPTGAISRLMGAAPLVGVGLISYSLYLWHWPLIVFASLVSLGPLSGVATIWVLVASVAAAWLSWRFVEQPFRAKGSVVPQVRLVPVALGVMGVAVAVGLIGRFSDGAPGRLEPHVLMAAAGASDFSPRRADCLQIKPWNVDADKLCRLGPDDDTPPRFIVWGDSHADAMLPGFETAANQAGVGGLIATYAACPPMLGVSIAIDPRDRCRQFNDAMLRAVERHGVKLVFLAARWPVYVEGMLPGEGSKHPLLVPAAQAAPDREQAVALFEPALGRTLTALETLGVSVWLMDPVPVPGRNVPRTLATAGMVGRDGASLVAPTLGRHENRTATVMPLLAKLETAHGFSRLDPVPQFCSGVRSTGVARAQAAALQTGGHLAPTQAEMPQRRDLEALCDVVSADGAPLYYDDDHLSIAGSKRLLPLFQPVLDKLATEPRLQVGDRSDAPTETPTQ